MNKLSNKVAIKLSSKINSYITKHAGAPAQKTAEWYSLKQKTIGGSEVATLLGLNPYKKPIALIAEKVGVEESKFTGNIATRWGTLFEDVTKQYTESILSMEEAIKETGSIPGVIDRQRYSPDGLGVVKLMNGDDMFEYYIILFEFKAPYSAVPDGKFPKHYMPQVQTGLLSIPLADTAIFVNNSYRKCKLSEVGFDLTYDKVFHSKDGNKKKKSQIMDSVLATGVICLYHKVADYDKFVKYVGFEDTNESDSDSDTDMDISKYLSDVKESDLVDVKPWSDTNYSSNELDMEILMHSRETPIDFGGEKMYIMERMFELFDEKRIKAVYYPMVFNNEAVNQLPFITLHNKEKPLHSPNGNCLPNAKKIIATQCNQFLSDCEDNEWCPIGFLPWKLMKSDVLGMDRDPEWKTRIEGPIKEALSQIDAMLASNNPHEAFYALYPPHDTVVDEDYNNMIDEMASLTKVDAVDDNVDVDIDV